MAMILRWISLDIETEGLDGRLYSIAVTGPDLARVFMVSESPVSCGVCEVEVAPSESALLARFFAWLTAHDPEPGKPVEYLEVVHDTRLPIVIMQPANSPTRFWVKKLQKSLEQGGSQVHVEHLPEVRPFFYSRPDATPAEHAMALRLPELVEQALAKLRTLEINE